MEIMSKKRLQLGYRGWTSCRSIALASILAVGTVLLVTVASYGTGPIPETQVEIEVDELLSTSWHQHGDYKLLTPYNLTGGYHERLGCWSVALAQILYHQRLQPHGSQKYEGEYYDIAECFSHPFRWNEIRADLEASPNPSVGQIIETALYCYYVSVTVEKDFGTGSYDLGASGRAKELEEHFSCSTEIRLAEAPLAWPTLTYTSDMIRVEELIRKELDQGCPLMLYTEGVDLSNDSLGHAMVIDGYGESATGDFVVHLNAGLGGSHDGWYALWEEIGMGNWHFLQTAVREVIKVMPRSRLWPVLVPSLDIPPLVLEYLIDRLGSADRLPEAFDFVGTTAALLVDVFGESKVAHARTWAVDFQDFVNLLLGFVMEGTGPGGALISIDGIGAGEPVLWHAFDLYPEPDPIPVCMQGQDLCISFALKSVVSGDRVVDRTANLLLTKVEPNGLSTVLTWKMIPYSAASGQYDVCLDTGGLEPGIYDLCLGTSRDGVNRRIEIEVVEVYPIPGVAPLLTTAWTQGGSYMSHAEEMLETSKTALGCWSTAYAQLFYYHGLSPHGTQTYTCKSNDQPQDEAEHDVEVEHEIFVDFDRYSFAPGFFDGTSPTMVHDIAEYCFLTAVAVKKNLFGLNYAWEVDLPELGTSEQVADEVARHYSVEARWYPYLDFVSRDDPDLQQLITSELHEGRPIWLYTQKGVEGHAMVIDGYQYVGDAFEVHLNMGWGRGPSNTWYEFASGKPIHTKYDDGERFWLVTIRPVNRPGSVTPRPAESP